MEIDDSHHRKPATKIGDSYHPYAIVTIVFWSLAYVFTRQALQYFSVYSLGFLRYLVASCALALVAVVMRISPPAKKDWGRFALSGAFGFFLYIVAFHTGARSVSSSTSAVIIATTPIMTALLAWLFRGEQLRSLQWAAMGVEFLGILVLTLMNGIFTINTGILWLLLAALVLSAYNLLQRDLTKSYSALQSSMYSIFAGTAMLGIFGPLSWNELKGAPADQLFYVAALGVFSSAVAYVCWSVAFAKAARTSSVSNYMFVTPFLTALLGLLIVGEQPDLPTVIGGSIVLAGVFMFNFAGRPAR